jgi:hypothetical protein
MLITPCYPSVASALFFPEASRKTGLSRGKSGGSKRIPGEKNKKFSKIFVQKNDLTFKHKIMTKSDKTLITTSILFPGFCD